jgi:hypothetical protein
MVIEPNKLRHWIENFYGYGSWDAPFWFIGYEESGGDLPEEVADKVNYFISAHPAEDAALCDIRELYSHAAIRWDGPKGEKFKNRFDFRFGPEAVQHGVWKNLIRFIHGYRGKKVSDLLSYQQKTFVSASSPDAALIPLYPLPSPHGHSWYYSWLDMPSMDFIKSRDRYEAKVYPTRIRHILNQIGQHKPEVVLMYGMNNINILKSSVQEFIPGAKFSLVKAVSRVTPQHHRTDISGTKLLITTQIPALRHNRVETGFDWEEFGRMVRGKR